MITAKLYRIENTTSGHVLGDYEAKDEASALDAMARDTGYRDHADACAVAPGDDLIAYEIPLSAVGIKDPVLVEWMPEYLRASHEAARNSGVWPHNGAKRCIMARESAEALVESDPDWTEILHSVCASDWAAYVYVETELEPTIYQVMT